MNKYLNDLSHKLKKKSFNCPYFIMQSNGGTTEFFNAKKHPLTLLESGPAAGVNGTSFIAKLINKKNVDTTKQPLFFGEELNLQRYDRYRYKKLLCKNFRSDVQEHLVNVAYTRTIRMLL